MRRIAMALASVLLAACVTPGPVPPAPAPAPASAPAPEAAARARPRPRLLTEREAVRRAMDVARDRGLAVDSVHHVERDPMGGWRIEVRGPAGDRAKVVLDAASGRLLKGRFRDADGAESDAGPPAG